jgi:hypothetical protein
MSDQRDALALRIALGEPPGDVAASLSRTPAWVRAQLATPDMQQRVRAVLTRIEDSAARARLKLLFAAPDLIDAELSIARDTSHREQGAMLRYLTDKLWPQRTIIEQRTEHRLDADLAEPLTKLLTDLHDKLRAGDERPLRIVEGDAALPHREISAGRADDAA